MGKIARLLANPPPPGHSVNIAGIIGAVRKNQTKGGDGMCQLTLEDGTGSVEVVLFPKVYAKNLTRLDCNQVVMVSGQFGNKEGGVKIIADSMSVLDKRHKISEVVLQIDSHRCNDEFFQRLQKVIAAHQGGSEVTFTFPEHGLKLQAEPQHWIDPSSEALKELEDILGKGNVMTN